MKPREILPAWALILRGGKPFLSIEVTKECPLRCPGCYAYSPDHLESGINLRQLSDYRGPELVKRILALVDELRPLHVSLIGGEPLVRYRELSEVLPQLNARGVETQVVTSAVRPIPIEWASLPRVYCVVSIDGLQPEHDRRRAPATYDRILRHIAGHKVIVHCTITRQQCRPGYLGEFSEFWSARPEVRRIWFSIYTPQEGEETPERLTPADRAFALREIEGLREAYPKIHMPGLVLDGFARPPKSPDECVFAQVTTSVSADLHTRIGPCQFGGKPVCSECGCIAAGGMTALSRFRLGGLVPLGPIYWASRKIGQWRAPKPVEQVRGAEEAA